MFGAHQKYLKSIIFPGFTTMQEDQIGSGPDLWKYLLWPFLSQNVYMCNPQKSLSKIILVFKESDSNFEVTIFQNLKVATNETSGVIAIQTNMGRGVYWSQQTCGWNAVSQTSPTVSQVNYMSYATHNLSDVKMCMT